MHADTQLSQLQEILKIKFNNPAILSEALTHRSFLNENKTKKISSNERLEFLGDAILSFWVSSTIFSKFPELPEGKLTFIRTHLVRTTTLTDLAKKLSLGDFLLLSRGEEQGGGRKNPVLLANCFEAVVGAVFSDSGLKTVCKFLEKHFEKLMGTINDVDALKDSKSLLQEKIQSRGQPTPVYKLILSCGPDHQRTFTMGVFVNDQKLAEGSSRSKQEAEELAAEKALEILP